MRSKHFFLNRVLLIIIILLGSLIQIPFVDAGWLPGGWGKRVKITIDSGDIDFVLLNFPILVYISSSSGINNEDITFIFDEVGPNSLRIAVTESDGTTECFVEIEKWDFGNEEAWLWVKGPSISSGADTDFYLYFDDTHADNVAHVGVTNSVVAENVWDIKYEFVSHMRDNPDVSNIRDSTSNDNDGAKKGANEPILITSGIIDGSQDFDEINDYVTLGDASFLGNVQGTVSFWVKKDTSNTAKSPWGASDVSHNLRFFYPLIRVGGVGDNNDRVSFAHYDGGYNYNLWTPENSFPDDLDKHLITFTSDGNLIKIYIDGVNQALFVSHGGNNGDWFGDLTGIDLFTIGELWYNTNLHVSNWGGLEDEFRVSSDNRGSAWIKASYETGIDDLIDWGEEEILIEPPSDPNLLFGGGFNSSTPYVELHWNHTTVRVDLFEVQNSSDGIAWDYLGQSTTTNYTDYNVVNGTERFYRVRACNQTGGVWFNSSFTLINFETVYFISEIGEGITIVESDAPWIALAIILSIIALLLGTRIKR